MSVSHMEDDLRNYRLQLQQVEAALTTDAGNEELAKLKGDLEEVIELTRDLIRSQREEIGGGGGGGGAAPKSAEAADDDDVTDSLLAAERHVQQQQLQQQQQQEQEQGQQQQPRPKRSKWKVGDRCMAKWQQDGAYYEAVIEEIMDSQVRVLYAKYNQLQVCHIGSLKDVPAGQKRSADDSGESKFAKLPSRDYLKKKKQKKQQRFKQIEEERESEKNKWISFTSKNSKKAQAKGKSIFASPETVNGRVGIGTCGISGKPMTEFSHGEMWRKGA